MTVNEIIEKVTKICTENNVSHLYLFGSYAKGTNRPGSDIDFVVKGTKNIEVLKDEINNIPTLKTIDLFDYDNINNKFLKGAIDRYGKIIY